MTKKKLLVLIFFATPLLALSSFLAYKVVHWKAYVWLPAYISQPAVEKTSGERHVIFLMVDHYEPGFEAKGVEKNRQWLDDYRKLADRHADSYGRKPQHTWFYAYDHHNDGVMPDLARAVYDGYGEVEFHWHHGNDSNETFPAKVKEAVEWFNSYGAMRSFGSNTPAFGFIHGNWSLDASGKKEHCGVTRELDILKEAGCYADFTFPALGNVAQPPKINSIYYARDDNAPKSYEKGEDAAVGQRNREGLMIFEGPLSVMLGRKLFEYGAVEMDNVPSPAKVDKWIDAGISVKGRPEWIFVKAYTHGIQGRKVFFSPEADEMFSYLEKKYGRAPYRLHYVTAREAYNIVRAAEDGLAGDPDQFRDYRIKPPMNRYVAGPGAVRYVEVTENRVEFEPLSGRFGQYLFKVTPVESVTGDLTLYRYDGSSGKETLEIRGKGKVEVASRAPLKIAPPATHRMKDGKFVYELDLE